MQLLNNPQVIVAVIALISALAAYVESRAHGQQLTRQAEQLGTVQATVTQHDQRLNGELDKRIQAIAAQEAAKVVPPGAVVVPAPAPSAPAASIITPDGAPH